MEPSLAARTLVSRGPMRIMKDFNAYSYTWVNEPSKRIQTNDVENLQNPGPCRRF